MLTLLVMTLNAPLAAAPLDLAQLDWVCVNDTVMGGVSQSQVERDGDALVFTGDLSLDNNGGFTSVRSQPTALSLGGTGGLRVTVLGDGRTYDFTARRSDLRIPGGSYRVQIETVAGAPITVDLPLSDFQATAYGRPISAPPLSAAAHRIDSLGFLLADKQPGPFRLEILAIEALPAGDEQPLELPVDGVSASFARVISRGVPVFNAGDPGRCAAMYQTAIEDALLLSSDLTPAQREALLGALQSASSQRDVDAAWTLRRAMDAVLMDRGGV